MAMNTAHLLSLWELGLQLFPVHFLSGLASLEQVGTLAETIALLWSSYSPKEDIFAQQKNA